MDEIQILDAIHVFIDGGCKGNGGPDPKGYASIAVYYNGKERRRISQELPGAKTNNEAEYGAFLMAASYIDGLKARSTRRLPDIVIHTDSQLLWGHLVDGFKVKAENLQPLFVAAKDWLDRNPDVDIIKDNRDDIFSIIGH